MAAVFSHTRFIRLRAGSMGSHSTSIPKRRWAPPSVHTTVPDHMQGSSRAVKNMRPVTCPDSPKSAGSVSVIARARSFPCKPPAQSGQPEVQATESVSREQPAFRPITPGLGVHSGYTGVMPDDHHHGQSPPVSTGGHTVHYTVVSLRTQAPVFSGPYSVRIIVIEFDG